MTNEEEIELWNRVTALETHVRRLQERVEVLEKFREVAIEGAKMFREEFYKIYPEKKTS